MITLSDEAEDCQFRLDTSKSFQRAEGYFELRMYLEALKELEEMDSLEMEYPQVLRLMINIYLSSKQYACAMGVATQGFNLYPANSIFYSFCILAIYMQDLRNHAEKFAANKVPDWIALTGAVQFNVAVLASERGETSIMDLFLKRALRINVALVGEAYKIPVLEKLVRQSNFNPIPR